MTSVPQAHPRVCPPGELKDAASIVTECAENNKRKCATMQGTTPDLFGFRDFNVSSTITYIPHADVLKQHFIDTEESHCCSGIAEYFNVQMQKLDSVSTGDYTTVRLVSDPFETLCNHVRMLLGIKHCNRGWLKMYEMTVMYKLVEFDFKPTKQKGVVHALFNCELPGGFILAAGHYLQSRGSSLDWCASSLHPTDSNQALQDSYNLVAMYPKRWLMTHKKGSNGDMTSVDAVEHLVSATAVTMSASNKGKVNLYVADGGMEVKDKYSHKEAIHQAIFLGELLVCVGTLAVGGNAVIKIYTICSDFMRSLVACASSMFKETRIVKPVTSRPVNTELYMVLRHFRGANMELARRMEFMLPSVANCSVNLTLSDAIFDMKIPQIMAFNTKCLMILESTYKRMEKVIDEHIVRCRKMGDMKTWKKIKLGPVDMSSWLSHMNLDRVA